jgi:glycosyltransferase involved in cell wall biosynthesis
MQNQVTLSIVMPVFNHTEELKTMLDSILDNSYQDWELLAVDDGSDEETKEVLKQYATQDKRINIIQREREPKGAQSCRNTGFELSRGEYIVFFDSDDYVAPYCLEQRVKELSKHPELDFMVFRSGTYYDGQFHTEEHKMNFGYPIYKDDIAAFSSRTLPFIVWNNIYRRSSLLKINAVWDVNLLSLQDSDFNIQTLANGLQYSYSVCPPDYGYRINVGSGNISGNINTQKHHASHLYGLRKLYSTIVKKYGSRYHHELFYAALFTLNLLSRVGDASASSEVYNIVRDYSPAHARFIRLQAGCYAALRKILPTESARKIAFAPYLIICRRQTNDKISKLKLFK